MTTIDSFPICNKNSQDCSGPMKAPKETNTEQKRLEKEKKKHQKQDTTLKLVVF